MLRFIKLRLMDDSGIARLSVDHITCYSEQGDSTRVITTPNVSTYVKETSEEIDKLIADATTDNATDQMIGRLRCESCWNYKARQDGLKTETLDLLGELQRLMRNGLLGFLKT